MRERHSDPFHSSEDVLSLPFRAVGLSLSGGTDFRVEGLRGLTDPGSADMRLMKGFTATVCPAKPTRKRVIHSSCG